MLSKKIKYLLTGMFLFFGIIIQTEASNIIDFSKKGSLEIVLKEKEENLGVSGAEITIYYIADIVKDNYNLEFEYIDELRDCNASLEDLETSSLPEEISKCISSNTSSIKEFTNEFGIVNFENLELGLYLVVQTNNTEGYSSIEPFLVMIPKVEDESWIFDIKATPKVDIYKVIDLSVNKVWNTDVEIKKIPEKVTIGLYKDENLIDTVVLNSYNGWTYTWKNIEKSDNYSVKEINVPEGHTPSYKKQGYTFTVINTDILPKTGQIYYPIVILSFLGIMFIFLGVVEQRKGK